MWFEIHATKCGGDGRSIVRPYVSCCYLQTNTVVVIYRLAATDGQCLEGDHNGHCFQEFDARYGVISRAPGQNGIFRHITCLRYTILVRNTRYCQKEGSTSASESADGFCFFLFCFVCLSGWLAGWLAGWLSG